MIFCHIVILKVKRYLGYQDSLIWKTISAVLKSLNWWSQLEILNEIPIFDAYGDINLVFT